MKKYNIETVYNYINGEDITDFTLEELESNTNFMIDVINVSNDKNFYNFTEDNVKTDYRFVKFIINKFKEDENLITVVSDTYIEKDSSINDEIDKLRHSATAALTERKDVIIVASVSCIYGLGSPIDYQNMTVSLRPGMMKDRDEVINHKSNRLQIELGKLKMNTEVADNLGMGFLIIYDSFNSSQIILDYYAKAIIEDIFEEYDIVLEDSLHQRFNTFEKIEKIGIKKYILDFIAVYDEMLSSYLSSHIYLLEGISKQLDKIKNNWNKYIETKERKKYNEIINKVHEYMEYEAADYYSLNETTLLYLVATNLGIEKTLLKYDSISEEYYQEIMEEAHFLLEVSKLSFNDRLNYNNIKKIILDILKDTQSSSQTPEEKTENYKKCKIIKLVKNEQRD